MKILPAEPGLYFFASFESGAHVYKVVAWSENENGGLDPLNRPVFPGECFICELRLPDHCFRWKHNKLFLLQPE
ncbi:TPA: hypothetical protein ACGPXA_004683, partial [Escherichia coli]